MDALTPLGWTDALAADFAALRQEDLEPARVVVDHGRFYRLRTPSGEIRAIAAGRLQHDAPSAADLPTVGDWVAVAMKREDLAVIRHVLPRRTKFARRSPSGHEQVVAANVDTVFLMMGLDADFNPRRLERYMAVALSSGARPVILLNKADLCPDVAARRATAESIASGSTIVTISLNDPSGHHPIGAMLEPARTVALLGSSGVGKSTLLNRLMGEERQRTNEVRAYDHRGKHTTTGAELFQLPGGALVIDTPGMRELQIWDAELTSFEDIEALSGGCRFRDCRHQSEPDCAVRAALDSGALAADRYQNFSKLQDELAGSRGRGKHKPKL